MDRISKLSPKSSGILTSFFALIYLPLVLEPAVGCEKIEQVI